MHALQGHLNTSLFGPDVPGPVNSTYMILNKQNLCVAWTIDNLSLTRRSCNHRDFQNIGVNGAREGDADNNLKYSLSRNQTTDLPILVLVAMIGAIVLDAL